MREEQDQAHCGQLPAEMLGPMVQAQRTRDAHLADRLLSADTGDGGILITGNGHARTDRGVPAHLARRAPGKKAVSVGLLEVSPEAPAPKDYAASFSASALPFDYVWFTPAMPQEDLCAANSFPRRRPRRGSGPRRAARAPRWPAGTGPRRPPASARHE
jgi:uncharacterized iron-regulated protein